MSKTKTITRYGMKSVIRTYRGHVIESFNMAQLLDKSCTGVAYSIFANEMDYDNGATALSVHDLINTLWQAKMFVDEMVERNPNRQFGY